MVELNDKQKSLLDATEQRPAGEIVGVLKDAKIGELDHFLSFDPEKKQGSSVLHGFDMELVNRNRDVTVDAQIMEVDKNGRYMIRKYDKEG